MNKIKYLPIIFLFLIIGCDLPDYNEERIRRIKSFWPDCRILSTNHDNSGYVVKNNNKIYSLILDGSYGVCEAKLIDNPE